MSPNSFDWLNKDVHLFVVIVGFICLLYLSLKYCWLCFYACKTFVYGRWRKIDLLSHYGEYVVITGATDGIGLEFAKQFAQNGHSIVALGRNESKLKNVKAMIEPLLFDGRNVITVQADLNSTDTTIYQRVAEQLRPFKDRIAILINNAGVGTGKPDEFLNISEQEILTNIHVNIIGVLMVTRAVLPFMTENRKGLIINVSSMAAYRPVPFGACYSASKKFVQYFGSAIRYEYKKYNIHVQTLYPSFVATKMAEWSTFGKADSVLTPTTYEYVKSVMGTIGRSNDTSGYWSHAIFGTLSMLLPSDLYNVIADYTKTVITIKR
ncbi:hydroxysteroid dehydrogenase-like protein 3 [Leptotrombidium deliense]|uniref:Hydroxysteroid dehydrogenase-like protein 3 n=1 Tax=Leptotrombidium deliense TaxID=299467 RepID=A0A443S6G1_9ACAR|nr:hydroxysteroid dehydrogenase-like protein 3 [Leptotrombidium deliense]